MFRAKQKALSLLLSIVTMLSVALLAFFTLVGAPTKPITASAADGTWTLVTATSDLSVGDQIIIAAKNANFALSTTQNSNNRGQAAITKSGNTMSYDSNVQISTLKAGSVSGTFAFYTDKGYLYAASSDKNYLRTKTSLDANGSWKIEIASTGVATIKAQGSYTRNWLRYNASNNPPIFSAYGSGQADIVLYKFIVNTCTHENTEFVSNENGTHTVVCSNCKNEQKTDKCSANTYSDWIFAGYGQHKQTGTCECGYEIANIADCEVESGYIREGNTHTQTGTCNVCSASTSVTGNCTLTYTYISNDDKTHIETSVCSECKISADKTVDCTFNKTVENTSFVYTCKYCEYSYSEAAATYTVTYSANGKTTTETVIEGQSPKFTAVADAGEFKFKGWATETVAGDTKPTLYTTYTITEDTTFYAVYAKETPSALITNVSQLKAGLKVIIAAKDYNFAMSNNQKDNNRGQVAITKSGNTVSYGNEVQKLTVQTGTTAGTYAFYTGSGYLYAASSSENYLRTQSTLDANGSWTIEIASTGVATIKAQGSYTRNVMQYNQTSSLFACYASATQKAICLYTVAESYYTTTPAKIVSASVTLNENLCVNYYATLDSNYANAKLNVTFKGETVALASTKQDDGRYKFSFDGIAPQLMGENVKAQLVWNDTVIDSVEEFSIKAYAENKLVGANDTLKNALEALLAYGEEAENYIAKQASENTYDAIAENKDFSLTDAQNPAYFTAANVWFDSANKIIVKLNTIENVTLTVNGKEVELTSTVYYTDAINVTDFDEIYTFELFVNGELMQTLTYSVNYYAFRMQKDSDIGNFVKALYHYGVAASAYGEQQ